MISYKIHSVSPETTVKDACAKMTDLNIGSLIVGTVDKPEGIFTERDLLRKVAGVGLSIENTLVKDVMTKKLITIREEFDPISSLKIIEEKSIRHLPVVDDNGVIIGILSFRNLLGYIISELENENEQLGKFLIDEISNDIEDIKDVES